MTTASIDVRCCPLVSVREVSLNVGCDGDFAGVALLLYNAIEMKTRPSQSLSEQIIMAGANLDVPRVIEEGYHYVIDETEANIKAYKEAELCYEGTIADFINCHFRYHDSLARQGKVFSPCVTQSGSYNKWTSTLEALQQS